MNDYQRLPVGSLVVPQRGPADYWLPGYQAGYMNEPAQPLKGTANAETYWRGYGSERGKPEPCADTQLACARPGLLPLAVAATALA